MKGDASICYLRKESIQLAIQMHDDSPLRYSYRVEGSVYPLEILSISVSLKPFSKRNNEKKKSMHLSKNVNRRNPDDEEDEKTKKLRWMHLQQQKQSLSWADDDEDTGGVGLRIIVIKNMFTLEETTSWLFLEGFDCRCEFQE